MLGFALLSSLFLLTACNATSHRWFRIRETVLLRVEQGGGGRPKQGSEGYDRLYASGLVSLSPRFERRPQLFQATLSWELIQLAVFGNRGGEKVNITIARHQRWWLSWAFDWYSWRCSRYIILIMMTNLCCKKCWRHLRWLAVPWNLAKDEFWFTATIQRMRPRLRPMKSRMAPLINFKSVDFSMSETTDGASRLA